MDSENIELYWTNPNSLACSKIYSSAKCHAESGSRCARTNPFNGRTAAEAIAAKQSMAENPELVGTITETRAGHETMFFKGNISAGKCFCFYPKSILANYSKILGYISLHCSRESVHVHVFRVKKLIASED